MTGGRPVGSGERTRILICDDATLNRDCLAAALTSHGFDVDCSWDLPSFLSEAESSRPDVVLLNINTRESATLLHLSLDLDADVRVVVIGLSEDEEAAIVSCAESGVAGLHLQSETLEQLLILIRETADGEPSSSPAIAAILMKRVYALVDNPSANAKAPALTDRENEILLLLEKGLTNQQIATRMHVSIHTVKNHAHSLFGKLGVRSRAEAVATYRAMRHSSIGSA